MTAPPSKGWYVEVDNSSTGYTFRPAVVDDPKRNPKANELPRLEIPVPRDEKWMDPAFDEAPLRAWYDGEMQPVEQLVDVELQEDRTVLYAIGGQELKDRAQAEYDTKEIHLAAETLITNETPYTPNVDVPRSSTDENVAMQSADTTTDFTNVTTIPADNPVYVSGGSLHLAQTCWVWEAETQSATGVKANAAYSGDGTGTKANATYFGGEFGTTGDSISFSFTPDHDISAGDLTVAVREDPYDADGDGDVTNMVAIDVTVAGETVFSATDGWGSDESLEWWNLGSTSTAALSAGTTYTVTIEETSAGGTSYDEWIIDLVAVYDNRYTYTWDNDNGNTYTFDSASIDNQGPGYLDGPELYPSGVQTLFSNVTSSKAVTGGRIESVWNDVSGVQKVFLSNDNGGTWPLSAANTDTYEADFTEIGTDIRWKAQLDRFGLRTGATPKTGYKGQRIDSFTLKADLSDIPILSNRNYDDSIRNILRDFAQKGDFLFEYRDDGTTKSIEWTQPGQRRSQKEPSMATYSVTKSPGEVYEKAIVYGSTQPVAREPFTANHGTAVALDQSNLVGASEAVYDPNDGTKFTRGDDYAMDYDTGEITTKSSGAMTDGSTYAIDYEYRLQGTYTAEGVTTPNRTLVETIPTITTQRTCDQAARILVQNLKTPPFEAQVVIPNDEAGWSVVDEIAIDNLPTNGTALQIKNVENTPQQTVVSLGNRESVSDIISDIQDRLRAVSKGA